MKGAIKYILGIFLILGLVSVAGAQTSTQPDIQVQNPISVSPVTVEQGEIVTIVASVFNSRSSAVTTSFDVAILLFSGGVPLDLPATAVECLTNPKESDSSLCVIDSLSPVGSVTSSFDVRFTLNTADIDPSETPYDIFVSADPDGVITNDANDGNNQGQGAVQVNQRQPNILILAEFAVSPESPRQGDLLTVNFNIENDRLENVPPFDISVSIRKRINNGTFERFFELITPALSCPDCTSTTLNIGQRRTIQARIATSLIDPGDYQMQIELDSQDIITEANEADNALTFDFTLAQPTRNLSLTSGQVSPAIASSNQDVVVNFSVTNTSNAAAENVDLDIALLGIDPAIAALFPEIALTSFTCTPVSAFVTADLAASSAPCDTIRLINANETLNLQARFNSGDLPLIGYDVEITLDSPGDFDETSEEDNSLAIFFEIADQPADRPQRGPELHPVSLELIPDSPITQGTSVLVVSNVKNSGNENASEFEVRFSYRSADGGTPAGFQVFESESISLLKIGISQDVKATLETSGLEPGLYDIQVELLSPNQTELDENNNTLIGEFTIIVE